MIDRLLRGARDGSGSVLVIQGDPGVGKTALMGYARESASGFGVVQTAGADGEMELAYAALQQLCAPLLDLNQALPEPQREALSVAFGLSAGPAPSPFLLGVAVLGLLSEAAAKQPLLCLVDDAQWLDDASATVMSFVARRLLAEQILFLICTRTPSPGLSGFANLQLGPLGHQDGRALLESVLPAVLDDQVIDRIVAETGGNPLALLELPRGMTAAQLAGGFGLPREVPLSASIEESYTRRLSRLPGDARRLLLVAAAEPTGDLALVWRAASSPLGVDQRAAEAVEAAGLVEFGSRVTFRHPLVRSAVYGAAGLKERHTVHRALADATDPLLEPDRRAWHRAHSAWRPDEQVAAELERCAGRAQLRGGVAASAAFLERAATLTPESQPRAARLLAAAIVKHDAGDSDAALELLNRVEAEALDESGRAQVELLRAQIALEQRRGADADSCP